MSVLSYGPTNQFDGQVGAPNLNGNGAQQIVGVGMVGIDHQHLSVTGLGFGQATRLMMREARPEEICDACLAADGRRIPTLIA
jgi:hypothetical protein